MWFACPELSSDSKCVNTPLRPPDPLIAVAVKFAVVDRAERNGELVRDLPTQCCRLRELQVMRVRPVPAADQTGLRGDEGEVARVADAAGLGECEGRLVDPLPSLVVEPLRLLEGIDVGPVRRRQRDGKRGVRGF